MKYRAEIDGLRALAVVPVILFHAGFELFSGGFVGVDVFFVISGYLITTILIEDIEKKRFSIAYFYERRARRILPALFFVMVACLPFAWMWMLPSQMKDFAQSLAAVSLFAPNILFWRESGYFEAAAEEKPLLHTWSLAVEEQYYVLFPVFLVLAWRFGKNRVYWMIVIMAVLSLFLSEWGWRNEASANFYLAPTRAWELFAGSISAFLVQRRGVKKSNSLAMLGLIAIFFSIFAYDESTPFPSVYALVPVLGVVLLVMFGDKETYAARFLSRKAFVGIGLISYSAYLWHQPLFAFARIRQGGMPSESSMVILSLLSIGLSYFSWKYVEQFFRDKEKVSRRQVFSFSLVGLAAFLVVGIFGNYYTDEIGSGRYNPYHRLQTLQLGSYTGDNKSLQDESWAQLRSLASNEDYAVANNAYDDELWFDPSSARQRILVVGNSHSKDIFNILSQAPPVLARYQVARFGDQLRNLTESSRLWQSKNYASATHVFLVARYEDEDLDAVPMIVERIVRDGKKAVIVENIFEFPGEASGYSLIDKVVFSHAEQDLASVTRAVNRAYFEFYKSSKDNRSITINARLREIGRLHSVPTLDRMDYICDSEVELCFAVEENLSKNFYDYGHHTLSGAAYFSQSERLVEFLRPSDLLSGAGG